MVDQFTYSPPDDFVKREPQAGDWMQKVTWILDDLTRAGGAIATGTETTETVLTQQEKLDLLTVTQPVDLDSMESDLAAIATGTPDYDISNDNTDRTLDANAAAGTISLNPTQAEVERNRDAILKTADVLSTLIKDLRDKGIVGV